MSNRKLSTFELELVSLLIVKVIADGIVSPEATVPLTKIMNCAGALIKNFHPTVNTEMWAAAHDPVFMKDPEMKGKNAIDAFLNIITDMMKLEMSKVKPEVATTVATETVTTTIVTETSTPVTTSILSAMPLVCEQ